MGSDNYFIQDHDYQEVNPGQIRSNMEITESYDQSEKCDTSAVKEKIKNSHIIIKDQGEIHSDQHIDSQQIIYLPSVGFCTEHDDLLLLKDERLVKPGDKFKTHNHFVQYLNENAKRWFYYYKCFDSRKPNTEQEMYLYTCVYLRNKEKYVKKGLRKRNNNHKTNCPCKIKLRHLPHEKELTVVFVCNHHDHPLSEEEFSKLQHGRRLPPHIKEEIMDLLTLQVDMVKIRKYVQIATGFNMSRAFFYAIERTLKSRNVKRHISDERVRTLIKRLSGNNIFDSIESKHSNDSKDRINEESETLQSVRNLQESVKCETQHNPWIIDQCVPVLPNGSLNVLVTNNALSNKAENQNKQYEGDNIEMIISNGVQFDNDITECSVQELENSVVYETVISSTDDNNEYNENVTSKYVYDDAVDDSYQIDDINSDNNVADNGNIVNCDDEIMGDLNNDAKIVEYLTDSRNECIHKDNEDDSYNQCKEDIVDYNVDCDNFNQTKDAEVETCGNISKQNPLVSVFDVCMKNGNVTGFIVNNEVMNQLKNDCVEKGVQTDEMNNSDDQSEDINDTEVTGDSCIELRSDGTYIKYEYVHKYNIDKYMCRPHFPKYINVLSKKTGIDVLQMFTNVYNERAMFKMTTTQSDREGNTRILYVTNPIEMPQNVDMKNRHKLGKHLKEVLVLKDKVRTLEIKNLELETINKQLIKSLR